MMEHMVLVDSVVVVVQTNECYLKLHVNEFVID
jgi:hypothetical protein